jgi:tetratricopeptide (TPR) repeat protein
MNKHSAFERGLRALESGEYERALREFSTAVCGGDRPALALCKRGVCWVRLHNKQQAANDFDRALELDAGCVPAIVNLGNLALEDGRLDEAQARYEAALRLDQNYAAAHYNLAILYKRRGQLQQSVRAFRLAAKLDGDRRNVLQRLSFWRT